MTDHPSPAPAFPLASWVLAAVCAATVGLYAVLAIIMTALTVTQQLTPTYVFICTTLLGLVRPSDQVLRYALIGETMPASYLLPAASISRTTQDSARIMGALTGAGMFAFLIAHLLGNLQVFGPPELMNGYAHFLKSKPGLLWGARLGLLACVALHVVSAVTLAQLNANARPEAYATKGAYGASTASKYMLPTGVVIAAFIVYHLAHFTALLPGVNGVGDFSKLTATLHGETVPDVYAMMVLGLQVPWVCLFYLIAQGLLFAHLGHGLAAMFQSLGWNNPRFTRVRRQLAVLVAAVVRHGQ